MSDHLANIIREITPLSENDCFYVANRHKTEFTFPLHSHPEYELTYVEKTSGIRRIVGDSVEMLDSYDLVLISSSNLEHAWEGSSSVRSVREITIQFMPDIFSGLLSKDQFKSISVLFEKAQCGVSFPMETIMKVYPLLDYIATHGSQSFSSVIKFMTMIYELSLCDDMRILSSSSFAKIEMKDRSRRILKVQKYIVGHYKEEIKLEDVAHIINMSPVAFSRFFKLRVGKTFSEYLTLIRIGYASRLIMDTNKTISEICYESGFNNISNFNRHFKKEKGCTPKEFREIYTKRE